jgi:hypothetical protein
VRVSAQGVRVPAEGGRVPAKASRSPAKLARDSGYPFWEPAAREFCDRYLDEVNSGAGRHMLEANGKYDVSRQLPAAPSTVIEQVPLLNAA